MIALSPQVMPITCKHSLDGGLCTCFSTMQTIIRQLYTQITSSIRGYLSSLKMLHSVPQQPFGNRNQTWDLWLQKCKYSPLVTAVEMFSASHYNWANTRRSPVPQLFIMTMNMGRKLFCPQKLARNKALWGHSAGQRQSHWTQMFPWLCQPRKWKLTFSFAKPSKGTRRLPRSFGHHYLTWVNRSCMSISLRQ